MNGMKMYEINGRFGRAEFNVMEEQVNEETTYGYATYSVGADAKLIDSSDGFIEGLPKNVSDDDYFKMVLISSIKGLKNGVYKNMNELHDLNKTLKDNFANNKSEGHGNILNGIDNMIASINYLTKAISDKK